MEKTNYGHGEIREICRKSGREGGEKEGGQERYRKYPVSQRRNSAQMLQIYFSGNKRRYGYTKFNLDIFLLD